MQDYDIKRGHWKNIEGNKLKDLMKDIFGNAKKDGACFVASYGALEELRVEVKGKASMAIETNMKTDVSNDIASKTIKMYNDFLLAATGFSSKERKKRVNEKLKKGKL